MAERILVTGASRGIGRAIAERLAVPGRLLLLHGRDRDALAETCARVEAAGGHATPLVHDLRHAEGVAALIADVGADPLHGLVNNAGSAVVKPAGEVTLEEWNDSLAVNLTAPFVLCQRLAPCMPRDGTIVNVLSVAARQGFAGWSAYCAAKFAIEGVSQCLREELRSAGVRVVNVYPAATATALWDGVAGEWPRERMLAAAEIAEAVHFALTRPAGVVVESLAIGNVGGNL